MLENRDQRQMPGVPRAGLCIAALAVASGLLTGCTDTGTSDESGDVSGESLSPSLPSVTIAVTCVGGGSLEISYGLASEVEASMKMPCDGREISQNRDESVAKGRLSVTVDPDGDQHWSALISRGGRAVVGPLFGEPIQRYCP